MRIGHTSHDQTLVYYAPLTVFIFGFLIFASVQTQSPVLQGKMLVPMATVRTAPAPAQQFPIVAPPLPVQNGSQTGSKVSKRLTGNTFKNI